MRHSHAIQPVAQNLVYFEIVARPLAILGSPEFFQESDYRIWFGSQDYEQYPRHNCG